jgi:hypothetical protein
VATKNNQAIASSPPTSVHHKDNKTYKGMLIECLKNRRALPMAIIIKKKKNDKNISRVNTI